MVGRSPDRKGLLVLAEGLGLGKSHGCNSCLTPRGSPVRGGTLHFLQPLETGGRNASCGFSLGRQPLPGGSGSSGRFFLGKF